MKMLKSVVLFLALNFLTLYIGVSLYGEGGTSNWYANLNRAPWEPPGWVFGIAWFTIMICFAFYMSALWKNTKNKKTITFLFLLQIILNISWNPTFFNFHFVLPSFVIICLLTILISYIFYKYWFIIKLQSILLLPYLLWLFIATSLNGYIFLYN